MNKSLKNILSCSCWKHLKHVLPCFKVEEPKKDYTIDKVNNDIKLILDEMTELEVTLINKIKSLNSKVKC